MSPPSRSRTLLQTAETLLIATAGGTIFTLMGFPAGLVSGSLLAVAAAALLGRPVTVPQPLARAISVLVGISLGSVVTPETLKGLAAYPVSIAVLGFAIICMIVATTAYLRFVHGWDLQSALFGASPGAMGQVMVLSAAYGADLRAIAIVQVMRVVVLTIGIPAGLAYFGLTATGMFLPRVAAAGTSFTEIAILVVVSTATALLVWRFAMPGGLMFGAMLGSSILHGGGFIGAALPFWVVAAAVIGIGAVTGSRFANTAPRMLLRYLGAALGSFAVAISIASFFVLLVTMFIPVRVADTVVAFSPGAQDTMMVLALALHLDPVFIGAHQLARYLIVTVVMQFVTPRLRRAPLAKAEPPRPSRPLED
jgi:membrane AbrB-like protein